MTEQEAIRRIKKLFKLYVIAEPYSEHYLYADAVKMSEEALEKQIPKKWQYEMVNDDDTYVCPCCKEYWYMEYGNPTTNEYNYCPNCGQALKWD